MLWAREMPCHKYPRQKRTRFMLLKFSLLTMPSHREMPSHKASHESRKTRIIRGSARWSVVQSAARPHHPSSLIETAPPAFLPIFSQLKQRLSFFLKEDKNLEMRKKERKWSMCLCASMLVCARRRCFFFTTFFVVIAACRRATQVEKNRKIAPKSVENSHWGGKRRGGCSARQHSLRGNWCGVRTWMAANNPRNRSRKETPPVYCFVQWQRESLEERGCEREKRVGGGGQVGERWFDQKVSEAKGQPQHLLLVQPLGGICDKKWRNSQTAFENRSSLSRPLHDSSRSAPDNEGSCEINWHPWKSRRKWRRRWSWKSITSNAEWACAKKTAETLAQCHWQKFAVFGFAIASSEGVKALPVVSLGWILFLWRWMFGIVKQNAF